MIKVTKWLPDTCKCVVEHDWEWIDPIKKEGVNSIARRLVSPCEFHQGKEGDDIVIECQTKNKALQLAAENDANLAVLNDNGAVSPNTEKISFSFDKDRKLILTLKVAVDKEKIQTEINTKLGIGKVEVH